MASVELLKVRRRGLLVASRERECLLEVNTCELQAGQSKAYGFNVGPYTEKVAGGESSGHYYSRPRAQNTGLARDEAKVCPLVVRLQYKYTTGEQ